MEHSICSLREIENSVEMIFDIQYQELQGYLERLKTYARHIEICGEDRNSYFKMDHDVTFMRLKRDYMGNDQLLPAYNLLAAVCDEYIAVVEVKPYASDMKCFVLLMEKFNKTYGHYPKYPIADAGYGSYNNYLYCDEHGIEKYKLQAASGRQVLQNPAILIRMNEVY